MIFFKRRDPYVTSVPKKRILNAVVYYYCAQPVSFCFFGRDVMTNFKLMIKKHDDSKPLTLGSTSRDNFG